MLSREKANNIIIEYGRKTFSKRKVLMAYAKYLFDNFNMPSDMAMEMLTMKTNPEYYTDFDVYCLLSAYTDNDRGKLEKYFTESEINNYSEEKYKDNKVKFPLRFKMVKITDNQWIGSTSVKELMKLKDTRLIEYNENTQRVMKHIVSGGEEYYQIDVDKKEVSQITESFENETYIPDTITLNIPEGSDYDFNESKCELIIREFPVEHPAFDILDGYHRYLGMSDAKIKNNRFDYPMELRIVAFQEDKARHMIWQMDQKHKMKKIDSRAYNQYEISTKIINRLNADSTFELKGEINQREGIINASWLNSIIDATFITNKANLSKQIAKEIELNTSNLLKEKINYLIVNHTELLKKKWDFKYLVSVVYIAQRDDIELEDLYDDINWLYKELCKEENKNLFTARTFSRTHFRRVDKLWEEQ